MASKIIKLLWIASIAASLLNACKVSMSADGPRRLGGKTPSLIIQDSIVIERSPDGASLTLTFETREAANCKYGYYELSAGAKSTATPNNCANSSATKFSETIAPVPKDQLIAIVMKTWPASGPETASTIITIPETAPTAGNDKLNLMMLDLNGHRLELTSIPTAEAPGTFFSKHVSSDVSCALSDNQSPQNQLSRGALVLQGLTSRGFVTVATTRESPSVLGGSFQAVQRQSTEWSVSAKTAEGFGQIRLSRPTLLASATFAGRDQSQGLDDLLEDIDAPAIKANASSSVVATWSLDGDGKSSTATFTVAPFGGFQGITCKAPATALKITVPPDLVAKIPTNQRLWMTLKIDSWQLFDKQRWAVRVSDWKSMGIQRL